MELVSIKNMPIKFKTQLLEKLGFDSDGKYVIDEIGNKIKDRYTNEEILVEEMIILPGSTIILNNNPLSISMYLEEFGDVI